MSGSLYSILLLSVILNVGWLPYTNLNMEFNEEEKAQLIQRFVELGVKPKADTKEEFQNWMASIVAQGVAAPEGEAKPIIQTVSSKEHIPRIPIFTGATPTKSEHVSFDVWQYEIKCLIKSKRYSNEIILQALRNSLRGEASKVVVRLGEESTVDQIVQRMNNLYGSVHVGQDVLAEFYSSQQGKEESIVAWSCRLEDLMQQAIEADKIKVGDKDEALRAKLWSGLKKELREISGHKYDTIQNYDKLLVELRKIEKDFRPTSSVKGTIDGSKKVQVNSVQTQDSDLKAMIEQLQSKFDNLEKRSQSQFRQSNDVTCWLCGQVGHVKAGCRNKPKAQGHLNKSRPTERGNRQAGSQKPQK